MEDLYIDKTNVGGTPYELRDTKSRNMISKEYDETKQYKKDDVVIFEGLLYICLEDTTGVWNQTQWEQISIDEYFVLINKKIADSMSDLTDMIGVLSNLKTAEKTNLVGAVNEVDTDLANFLPGSNISGNASIKIDTLTTPGFYYVGASNGANENSVLIVSGYSADYARVTQLELPVGRVRYYNGSEWSVWKTFADQTAVNALNEKLGDPGDFKIATLYAKDLDTPPNAFITHTAINPTGLPPGLAGNSCVVIQQNPGSSIYNVELAFSFGADKIALRRKGGAGVWTDWKYFASMEPLKYWQPQNVKGYNANRCWYVKNGNLITISFQVETFDYVEGNPQVNLVTDTKSTFDIVSNLDGFSTCFGVNEGTFIAGVNGTRLYIQILKDVIWKDGTQIYGQLSTYFT